MSFFESVYAPKAVGPSQDLERVLALPRRTVGPEALKELVRAVTKALIRPDAIKGSINELLPIQAQVLYELAKCGGVLGPVGVGHGKTGMDILAPLVVPDCRVCVLLVPASLKGQMTQNWWEWAKTFKVPNLAGSGRFNKDLPTTFVVSYNELSNAKASELLESIGPDLIVCDEAHNLRYKDSARTRRLLRYVANHPSTRVCAWSGTLTNKSLKDYAHLSANCLKKGSPLPVHWATVEEWAGCLDANPRGIPAPVGSLSRICHGSDTPREGFRKRLVETPGVVATDESAIGTGLYILERKVEVPQTVERMLQELRDTGERPDGERFVEDIQIHMCARQLASGFWYRWVYPRGESDAKIKKWLEVRKNWHKELREKLKQSKPHLDSPLLCTKAAIRFAEGYDGPLPTWDSNYWPEWKEVRLTVRPETEAVWVSDYLIQDVLKCEKGSLVWYEHDAFGKALSKELPTFGPGDDGILSEDGSQTVAVSIRAHGTGKNLQAFSGNVLSNYPSAHAAWEQLLGRTHRPGQKADEVLVSLYRHTPELRKAFDTAMEYARYAHQTLGGAQKLLYASLGFSLEENVQPSVP